MTYDRITSSLSLLFAQYILVEVSLTNPLTFESPIESLISTSREAVLNSVKPGNEKAEVLFRIQGGFSSACPGDRF